MTDQVGRVIPIRIEDELRHLARRYPMRKI